MAKRIERQALLIAGPTASGKSALALEMARQRNGVIINADAMQVYRELRILTARPSPQEETIVPHRLYGHALARNGYSVGQWLAEAKQEIEACWREGRLPILVGGTGLYFKALEEGLTDLPPIPDDIRQKWRQFSGNLFEELQKRSPDSSTRLNSNDRQRLIRELEVLDETGRPLYYWQNQSQNAVLFEKERIYLNVDRRELYARAEARFDAMIAAGALDEVGTLSKLDLDPMLPAMKAIGVPELSAHLRGEISLEEAITKAKTATRHYIKRQLTWRRGQMKAWPTIIHKSSENMLV